MPVATAVDTPTLPAPQRGVVASVARVRPSVPRARVADHCPAPAGWWRGGRDGSVTIDDDLSVAAMSRRIRLRAH